MLLLEKVILGSVEWQMLACALLASLHCATLMPAAVLVTVSATARGFTWSFEVFLQCSDLIELCSLEFQADTTIERSDCLLHLCVSKHESCNLLLLMMQVSKAF
jgi:hypothetical protein